MGRQTTWAAVGVFFGGIVSALSAQPAITSVQNAASNIAPGFPNAGIAQGAIFVLKGSGLGPAALSVAPKAFQATSLSGTSVAVTVNGTVANALMYYTSATQVAAVLPSNTPVGTGTIAVTYNSQTSATAPITVVANNLGIFTIDSTGAGPGILTYADYSLVSPVRAANCGGPDTTCGAANPGDTLILWATGLGPVSGSDASGAGLGVNMPSIPLTLWLGGVKASVTYQGRSGCCIGEDQIVFTVPDNVPAGCSVPLTVQIGNQISNTVVVPIGDAERICSFVNPALSAIGASEIQQLVAAGAVTFTSANVSHFSDGGGKFEDDAKFQFLSSTGYVAGTQPFFVAWTDEQPAGACMVFTTLNGGLSLPFTGGSPIDGGTNYTLSGPQGSVTLPLNGSLTAFNSTGAFLVPGEYTFTGNGGSVIGSFDGSFTIPPAITLVAPANNGTATRANGLTVSWTGGGGNLQIQVNSCTDSSCKSGASAVCNVPASAGTFTVPAYVLDALPAGSSAGVVVSSYSSATFSATGLDSGVVSVYSNIAGFGYGWGSGAFTLK